MNQSKVYYAHSAFCTWWDDIQNAGLTDIGVLCCPYCGSFLYETGVMDDWLKEAEFRATHNKEFAGYLEWSQGKCYPTYKCAMRAYSVETSIDGTVQWAL